jgi:hypothetical protein
MGVKTIKLGQLGMTICIMVDLIKTRFDFLKKKSK